MTTYPCSATRPFHIPYTDERHKQWILTEDERGPKLLRRVGMTWLYVRRPSQEEIDEILAATGND